MNQHQKYSCKRSLLIRYINFVFPDFSCIEVLKNKSGVTFDGVEFKFTDPEYREYTESQLDLLAAGNSSSGASISSKSRKRRVTRTILYKCRNAYCKALNKEICIPDFIEILTNEQLEIPAEVSCNNDPEINEVQFDVSKRNFYLRIQSIQENSLQLSIDEEFDFCY
ncbi:hypothetical protein BpHYR1_034338 [Brachionus plicatilis]|uniref:Uncharacterized protein n=1 Tax=Brachionus plicatilis TaxID=10195 RepID=A0A3M7PF13_BRAPC|nr:hypothetical protein BpHYR1_034338 [Brachionus plicatilis]